MTVHSAARIALWCGWAIGVESVSVPTLAFLAVVAATVFVFTTYRSTAWRLLYRARWLMLVLFLTYAFILPGHLMWPGWGSWSPTQQGMVAGVERVLRISLMLIGLAVLLVSTSRARLIYGMYVLLRPFEFFGVDRRALAVRLGLTLEYIEHETPGGSMQQWLARLKQTAPQDTEPGVHRMPMEHWHWYDSVLMLGVVAAVLAGMR